jgi:hypothetical protein
VLHSSISCSIHSRRALLLRNRGAEALGCNSRSAPAAPAPVYAILVGYTCVQLAGQMRDPVLKNRPGSSPCWRAACNTCTLWNHSAFQQPGSTAYLTHHRLLLHALPACPA